MRHPHHVACDWMTDLLVVALCKDDLDWSNGINQRVRVHAVAQNQLAVLRAAGEHNTYIKEISMVKDC